MSIEAMKLALEAVQDLRGYRPDIDSAIETLRTAIQQAEAQQPATGEPVYWEWRHLGNNQFAADFGQWSEWKRVEARNPIFTAEDELRTLRRYIADGYKYELRALYDHPAPSVPGDDFDLICNAIDKADTITMEGDYMLDSDDCIAVVRVMQVLLSVRAAMLAAKDSK